MFLIIDGIVIHSPMIRFCSYDVCYSFLFADVRKEMLREAGYSMREITTAISTARKDKERRHVSIQNQKFDPFLEKVEGVKRMLPRTSSFSRRSSEDHDNRRLSQRMPSFRRRSSV